MYLSFLVNAVYKGKRTCNKLQMCVYMRVHRNRESETSCWLPCTPLAVIRSPPHHAARNQSLNNSSHISHKSARAKKRSFILFFLLHDFMMPAKYSHAKKRLNAGQGQLRKASNGKTAGVSTVHGHSHRNPNPHLDRSITQAMSAVSELEHAIARILLLRYEQDIARLYSTRLHSVALIYLPKLILDCIDLTSPGWIAANADCDEIKDYFRSAIAMDMRQAGERVATKSVLWSYTALRHFVCIAFNSSL